MINKIEINACFNTCRFFGKSMDGMYCGHPYWKDKELYENMIITQENSKDGNIPEKCPLKIEDLTIIYKLSVTKK